MILTGYAHIDAFQHPFGVATNYHHPNFLFSPFHEEPIVDSPNAHNYGQNLHTQLMVAQLQDLQLRRQILQAAESLNHQNYQTSNKQSHNNYLSVPYVSTESTSVVEPVEIQRQSNQIQSTSQMQNLLGVAYSPSTSVSHTKVEGNGYKFDF